MLQVETAGIPLCQCDSMLESRMALDERLRSKFGLVPSQGIGHPGVGDGIGPVKDPYAFHDEGLKDPPKERKPGRSKTIAQLTGLGRSTLRKPTQRTSQSSGQSTIAKLYPALAGKLGQQPQVKAQTTLPLTNNDGKISTAETLNKLENKISQSRIRDKQKKAQASSKLSASVKTIPTPTPAPIGVFNSLPGACLPSNFTPLPASVPGPPAPVLPHPAPLISPASLPPSFAYANLGGFPPASAKPVAFQQGPPLTAQPTAPVKESGKNTHKHSQKQSSHSSKSEQKEPAKKLEEESLKAFRQIRGPQSPLTITSIKVRTRHKETQKDSIPDDEPQCEMGRKLYKCLGRKRKHMKDLIRSGIDSSDDSDSDIDSGVPWQQEWFRSSSSEELSCDELEPALQKSRCQRLALQKARCRQQLLQIMTAQGMRHCKKGCDYAQGRLLLAAALRDAAVTARVLASLREQSGSHKIRRKCHDKATESTCLHKVDDAECGRQALPFANHCLLHITYNVDQQIFDYCTAKFSDNTQCCVPVFDIKHELPLCPEHAAKADNYNKLLLEGKPRKPRKKTKPSAMTRPPKKGKKKKNQRKNNKSSKTSSSPLPSADEQEKDDPSIQKIDFNPPLSHVNELPPTLDTHSESEVEDMDEPVLDTPLSPGAIDKTLGEIPLDTEQEAKFLPLDTDQAAKFLDEADLHDVFNKLPEEAFDLFTGKNGLLPTKEETEELERALAAASRDVVDAEETLAKLSQEPSIFDTASSQEEELPKDIADEILDHEMGTHRMGSTVSLNEDLQVNNLNFTMGSEISTADMKLISHSMTTSPSLLQLPGQSDVTKSPVTMEIGERHHLAPQLLQSVTHGQVPSLHGAILTSTMSQSVPIPSGLLMTNTQSYQQSATVATPAVQGAPAATQVIGHSFSPHGAIPNVISSGLVQPVQSPSTMHRSTHTIMNHAHSEPAQGVTNPNLGQVASGSSIATPSKSEDLKRHAHQVPQSTVINNPGPKPSNILHMPQVGHSQQDAIPSQELAHSSQNPGSLQRNDNTSSQQHKKSDVNQTSQLHLPVLQRQLAAGPLHQGPLQLQISGAISQLGGAVITLTPQGAIATPLTPGQLTVPRSLPSREQQGHLLASTMTHVCNCDTSSTDTISQNSTLLGNPKNLSEQELKLISGTIKGDAGSNVTSDLQSPGVQQAHPTITATALGVQGQHSSPVQNMIPNILNPQILASLQGQALPSGIQNGIPQPAPGSIPQQQQGMQTVSGSKMTMPLPHFVLSPPGMLGQGNALLVQPSHPMFQMSNMAGPQPPQQQTSTPVSSS